MEFGQGSQVNIPIAVLLWLIITPMMMRVDFTAIRGMGRKPKGLMVTLFINWVVKPFSMALIAWVFIFAFQTDNITGKFWHVVLIAIPIQVQVYFNCR